MQISAGINIFSGQLGLGGALTNPTVLSKRKGNIIQEYSINYLGNKYADVESAYLKLKSDNEMLNDQLMISLIIVKLYMYPSLFFAIKLRGGLLWLEKCTHFTYAKSPSFKAWEGSGTQSRFIRNLMTAYEQCCNLAIPFIGMHKQLTLF